MSTKLKKSKRFYFTNTYFPQSWNFLREKLETVNKSISKNVETFVMFLYLQNGKCVSNFIHWLFLFDFSRSGNFSNNNVFHFYSFFPQTDKSLSKTLYLREIQNVIWKWKKITKIPSCNKSQMLLGWIVCL